MAWWTRNIVASPRSSCGSPRPICGRRGPESTVTRQIRPCPWLILAALCWSPSTILAGSGVQWIPEMQILPGIQMGGHEESLRLTGLPEAARGQACLERQVQAGWPEILAMDFVALSRSDREATQGWVPPLKPVVTEGRALSRDPKTGHLYLQAQGPRLASRHDIVHRHLFYFTTYDPVADDCGPLLVTIRGWVLE